ncbi:MAG TPA: hypothetical protein VLJ10_05440, partial [Candidatus Bathyarchaeia archaeon]|nr:hypothetical protein [Candidatus Bathyarchaeia archaeon]
YDYIKEESDPQSGEVIPQRYFSGGAMHYDKVETTSQMSRNDRGQVHRKVQKSDAVTVRAEEPKLAEVAQEARSKKGPDPAMLATLKHNDAVHSTRDVVKAVAALSSVLFEGQDSLDQEFLKNLVEAAQERVFSVPIKDAGKRNKLQLSGLLKADGTMSDILRDIVLSSVQGTGRGTSLRYQFVSPLKEESQTAGRVGLDELLKLTIAGGNAMQGDEAARLQLHGLLRTPGIAAGLFNLLLMEEISVSDASLAAFLREQKIGLFVENMAGQDISDVMVETDTPPLSLKFSRTQSVILEAQDVRGLLDSDSPQAKNPLAQQLFYLISKEALLEYGANATDAAMLSLADWDSYQQRIIASLGRSGYSVNVTPGANNTALIEIKVPAVIGKEGFIARGSVDFNDKDIAKIFERIKDAVNNFDEGYGSASGQSFCKTALRELGERFADRQVTEPAKQRTIYEVKSDLMDASIDMELVEEKGGKATAQEFVDALKNAIEEAKQMKFAKPGDVYAYTDTLNRYTDEGKLKLMAIGFYYNDSGYPMNPSDARMQKRIALVEEFYKMRGDMET